MAVFGSQQSDPPDEDKNERCEKRDFGVECQPAVFPVVDQVHVHRNAQALQDDQDPHNEQADRVAGNAVGVFRQTGEQVEPCIAETHDRVEEGVKSCLPCGDDP